MNYDYIYDIFETSDKTGMDLNIALDILRGTKLIPEGMTHEGIRTFVNAHYDPLWRAYQTGNRKLFADIAEVCEDGREHEEEILRRAKASGNEKLIADMEELYGTGE